MLRSQISLQVCGGRVLDLFHSRELMSLVAGTENYNWKELEESANYKVNGPPASEANYKVYFFVNMNGDRVIRLTLDNQINKNQRAEYL